MKIAAIIWAIAILLFIGAQLALDVYTADKVEATETTCPEGQRPSGGGACRIEPTGCPFAEQTPMSECFPTPDLDCNEDWSLCEMKPEYKIAPTPVVEYSSGK